MDGLTFSAPRRLESDDEVEAVRCGITEMDAWLLKRARKARSRGIAVVYGSFAEGTLTGFYSLSTQSTDRGQVRGWLSRNVPEQIPVILLGMLGVDRRYQGRGLGSDLLSDAVRRSLAASQVIGARALVVDPYDDNARGFYAKWGFREVPGCARMFARLV